MVEPKIIFDTGSAGFHNQNLDSANDRLLQSKIYQDCSTICVIPTRGNIPARVVQSWLGMMTPMNQKFMRCFIIGMEVGAAYSTAVEQIIANTELGKWKYILTLEEDNMPPPDGLLKLIESIGEYDAVGGLYWTKGEAGQPMIYGNPNVMPLSFMPQPPQLNCLQRCHGLGMGFTLFKLEMLKDARLPKPLFKSEQEYISGQGIRNYTQDLYFFENAGKLGYKFACDTRVAVGHFDIDREIVW